MRLRQLHIVWNQFSTSNANLRVPLYDPVTKSPMDYYLHKYPSGIRAYLDKRRITREQVWPKIHIIEGIDSEQLAHLKYQRLFLCKKAMQDGTMKKIVAQDPSLINSAFIISIFSEDHFKEMMDEYLSKLMVCGKAPKDAHNHQRLEHQVLQLYRIFYFGEKIGKLQKQVELQYLAQKQHKWALFKSSRPVKKSIYRCQFTFQDQRVLEDIINWKEVDTNLSDSMFRFYFEPLSYLHRAQAHQLMLDYCFDYSETFLTNLLGKKNYAAQFAHNKAYYNFVLQKIWTRLSYYIKSEEFNEVLRIPPDHITEKAIYHMHYWMVINRLRQFNRHETNYIAAELQIQVKNELQSFDAYLNARKQSQLKRSIAQIVVKNELYFKLHFQLSNITKDNHYKGIDALVWSLVFLEKVERYDDCVYLYSEYMIRSFEHLQRHTYQDFMDGILEFDPYLLDASFKQKIMLVNPQLSAEEFAEEFESDKQIKKYYYQAVQEGVNLEIHKDDPGKFRLRQFIEPLVRFCRKFYSLRNYDHYSEMDRMKKEARQVESKSVWKTHTSNIDNITKEHRDIQALRVQRKKDNSFLKIK